MGLETESKRAPTLGQALDEGRLAGAQLAAQADQIAGLEGAAQAHADAAGLLGAATEELKGVFIEDGHREGLYVRG